MSQNMMMIKEKDIFYLSFFYFKTVSLPLVPAYFREIQATIQFFYFKPLFLRPLPQRGRRTREIKMKKL